ncbi:hypothetical protein FHT39_004262 [Mitsuaria sp. BK045]|uniref:PhaM family polyhydroxyalkanoate granule multifunctional regulatory protein n=1 Tax=unclassified Roseateles TaxID=2626991 RepID=UPI00160FB59B|nr:MULTISPECIES: PhaM family polyhydroxyalkanoate granule multifunctional regulatory protein [unclassified Roseateles]MBB3295582.1 hypothetical protein [Mitsuaria sp. BK041]MBB3364798.1 hypothetical protein [Mitsuaria sp. BK045]
MADTDFSKFVPGFDFLQGLMKNAGAAIPGFNQWVAPTLDPQELDKRIDELRTVQFWLENNARMLTATIQALEVQRMTLSTLHAMNVPMADLKDALKTPVPPPFPGASSPSSPSPSSAPAPASKATTAGPSSSPAAEPASKAAPAEDAAEPAKAPAAPGAKPAGADPMQWWNALTQQFTQVAANAMKSAQTAASVATAASTVAASSAAPAGRPAATRPSAAKGTAKASTDRAPRAPAKSAAKASPARKTTASKRKTP